MNIFFFFWWLSVLPIAFPRGCAYSKALQHSFKNDWLPWPRWAPGLSDCHLNSSACTCSQGGRGEGSGWVFVPGPALGLRVVFVLSPCVFRVAPWSGVVGTPFPELQPRPGASPDSGWSKGLSDLEAICCPTRGALLAPHCMGANWKGLFFIVKLVFGHTTLNMPDSLNI